MIGEVTAKVVEVTAKVAEEAAKETAKEVTKEVAKEAAKETGKAIAEKSVDITKRIDATKKPLDIKGNGVDITKRIVPERIGVNTSGELSPIQVKELIKKGMSPGIVNDCTLQNDVYKLKTVNEKLVDTVHPESKVSYVKKVIDLFGTKIEGVFPKFDAVYTTNLPPEKLLASDKTQFEHCISKLQQDIKDNPALQEKFSKRQIEQIKNGKTPSGYTWHHNEEVGKMELVDSKIHDISKHTGGKAIWGGGKDFR